MAPRWLLSGLLVFVASLVSYSQQIIQHYDSGNTYREVVDAICNDPNNMCHYFKSVGWNDSQIKEYTYRGIQNGYVVEFMNWRMVFPLGYKKDRAEGYPIILMLHGGGESGRKWGGTTFLPTEDRFDNNGYNVIHGGQEHLAAVNRNPSLSNAFPGIVIWPQVSYNGAWENGWDNGNLSQNGRMTAQIVEWVIQHYNGDPDRVAVHGLSNGAKGSWDIAAKRPDLFAAVLPMSGVGSDLAPMADSLVTTPLWLFQGGTDTNPRPQAAVDWIAGLQQIGGNPRYTYYPTLGHGTWTTAYAEPDFFPWILSKNKKNIYVYGGDPSICAGGTLKLGFSANMAAYQWYRNDIPLVGETKRFYNVIDTATYVVKFKRKFLLKGESVIPWVSSNPVHVTARTSSSFTPVITSTGSTNLTINLGGVQNVITLKANSGYNEYRWYKNGVNLIATTPTNTYSFSDDTGFSGDAGSYTVKIKEQTGCLTDASNGIVVNWFTTQPTDPALTAPTVPATSSSPTEIQVTWTDYPNENKYELWRFRFGDSTYPEQKPSLVAVLDQNTTSYVDKGLRPGALYKYNIRAILPTGDAIFSPQSQWGTLGLDNIPPTAPTNLVASNIKEAQVSLSWDVSTDNDVVYAYEIYNGATLVNTLVHPYTSWSAWSSSISYAADVLVIYNNRFYRSTATQPNLNHIPPLPPGTSNYWVLVDGDLTDGNPAPPTTYTVTGLITGFTYFLSVRAIDFKGNYSPFAESVTVSTLAPANGLTYKYYQFTGTMPGNGGAQLVEPRANNSFDFTQTPIATGTVGTFDISPRQQNDNFVFAFDGFIDIPSSGNYWFYTSSDDGSRLYINGSLLVNNDGAHGPGEKTNNVSPYNGATIPLSAGKIPIRVTFFEQSGGEALTVSWQKSGGFSKQVIPASALFQTGTTIVNYYSQVTGDLTSTTKWGKNTDGTGENPTNFTGALNYFNIRNRAIADINSTWSVSGVGSKIIVGDGSTAITANLNAAVVGTMDANDNTTINVNNTTLPQFGVLHPNSTVNFIQTGNVTIPNAMYGNVKLTAVNQYALPQNNTIVQGNFSIENGVTTTGVANNLSTLRIGGDLNINNTSVNPFPTNGPNQYSLVFTGSKSHTVSFAIAVDPTLFSIQADLGDTISFTGLGVGGRTFTVGSSQGGGLTLKGGAKLNLANNKLTVTGRGTINNNNETGALSMQGGELTLSTAATQNNSLYFSANDFVSNLTTSIPAANRVSILTTLNVNNLVTVNGGELNAGEGYLVLRSLSDAGTGTARIAPLLNGAKVTGKINAQRYMSGEGRIYRYISSPVKGITAATLQNYFPITGNFTGTSTNYTPPVTTNTSMWSYSEPAPANGYVPFPSNGGSNQELLASGKGYSAFIRQASAPTVMQMVGEPYQGTIDFALTGGTGSNLNGWNLLGNPYAAPIKWTGGSTGWSMSGVSTTAYVIDNSGGTTVVKSHNGISGTNSWNGVIAPGQAFWVRTTSLTPTLSVNENAKQITDGEFYREGGGADNTLEIIMSNATSQDAAIIQLIDGATPAFDTTIDGVKRNNSYFNLSTLSTDNKPLVINQTTTNYCAQEIKLHIDNAAVGTYGIAINGLSSLISGDKVTLIDTFLQTEKVISESENLSFTITSDAASKADGRFTLRFEKPEVVLNQILKSSPACEQSTALVLVGNSQPGVSYQAFFNGAPVTEVLTSAGGTLEIPVNSALVGFGTTTLQVKGGFKGCTSFDLPMQVAVTRDTLTQPEIIKEPLKLIASTEAANYQWYFNGEIMNGQTARELLVPKDGLYFVEVTLSSCSKVSDTVSYVVTGIEKFNRAYQLYPNPTRDKVIVTLEQPINFESLRVISSVGQVLTAPVTQLSAESAEVDFINLPTGLYILQVNGHRYRVLKE